LVIELDAFTDSVTFNVDGFTADATRNIVIRPAAGAEHGGVIGAGYVNTGGGVQVNVPYTTVSGIETNGVFGTSFVGADFYTGTGTNLTVENCIFLGGGNSYVVYISATDNSVFRNCLVVGTGVESGLHNRRTTALLQNFTIVGVLNGLTDQQFLFGDKTDCVNTVIEASGVCFNRTTDSGNNASSDATATGTGSITNITTADFVDFAGGDYRPAIGGALHKAGTNLNTTLTKAGTDITGDLRVYWDIGAFNAVKSSTLHKAWPTVNPNRLINGSVAVAAQQLDFPSYVNLGKLSTAFWDTIEPGGGSIRVFRDGNELPREVMGGIRPHLMLNGTDQAIEIPAIDSTGVTDFEVEISYLWVSENNNSPEGLLGISSSFNDSVSCKFVDGLNQDIVYFRYLGASQTFIFPLYAVTKSKSGQHSLQFIFDGTDLRCFCDGVESDTGPLTVSAKFEDVNRIGQMLGDYSNIGISRVTYWDSATRIADPIHDWRVTNATSGKVVDFGSAGIDGVLINAPPLVPAYGELHVKLDFLSAINPTRLDIFTDGVSADYPVDHPMGRNVVWSDYAGVYHVGGDPSATLVDSSGSGLDMTTGGSMVSGDSTFGKLGNAVEFNGLDQYGQVTTSPFSSGTSLTVQGWINRNSTGRVDAIADVTDKDSALSRAVLYVDTDNAAKMLYGGISTTVIAATGSVSSNTPSLIHGQVLADGKARVYLDGGSPNTTLDAGEDVSASWDSANIARFGDSPPNGYASGWIDEVRYRESLLDADWIATEYQNQAFPDEFWDAGTDSFDLVHVYDLTTVPAKIAGDLQDYVPLVTHANLGNEVFAEVPGDGGGLRFYKEGGALELPHEVVNYIPAHLSFPVNSTDFAQFAGPVTASGTGDWELEIVFRKTRNDATDELLMSSSADPNNVYVRNTAGRVVLTFDAGVAYTFNPPVTLGPNEGFSTLRVTHDTSVSARDIRVWLDGVAAPENGTVVGVVARPLRAMDLLGTANVSLVSADVARVRIWHDLSRRNLVHSWTVEDSTTTTVEDKGSAGNDATLNGTTAVTAKALETHLRYPGLLSSTEAQKIEVYAKSTLLPYDPTRAFGRNAVWVDYELVTHFNGGVDATGKHVAASDTIGDYIAFDTDFFPNTRHIADTGTSGGDELRFEGLPDMSSTPLTVQGWMVGRNGVVSAEARYLNLGKTGSSGDQINSKPLDTNEWLVSGATAVTVPGLDVANVPYYAGYAYDGVGGVNLFIEGESNYQTPTVLPSAGSDVFAIGRSADSTPFGSQFVRFGEARLRYSELSADWISTEYNNQSDPATFWGGSVPGGGASTTPVLSNISVTSVTFESVIPNVTVTF
jgi:hypothetical protein